MRAIALVLLIIVFTSSAFAEEVPPSHMLFNNGIYRQRAVAEAKGLVSASSARSQRIVSHTWVETHLDSQDPSSKNRFTVFGACSTVFDNSWVKPGQDPWVLNRFEVCYLRLNWRGEPLNAGRFAYVRNYDRGSKKWRWERKAPERVSVKGFLGPLVKVQREQLSLLLGFLDQNPGEAPVPHYPSDSATALGVLELALSVAPGFAKAAFGKLAERAIRKGGPKALRAMLEDETLGFGGDEQVSASRAKKFRADYLRRGKATLAKLGR